MTSSLNTLQQLLTRLLDIPVQLHPVEGDWLASFCAENCFAPDVQAMLTERGLAACCAGLHPYMMAELRDVLGIRLVLLRVDEWVLLTGPFVKESWSDVKGASRLAAHGLPSTLLISYKLYYCRYRILQSEMVMHSVEAAASTLLPDASPIKRTVLQRSAEVSALDHQNLEPPDYQHAIEQYEAENEMIRMVQKGDLYGARAAMQKDASLSKDIQLPYIQNSILLTGSHIFRTLLRKAAFIRLSWMPFHSATRRRRIPSSTLRSLSSCSRKC